MPSGTSNSTKYSSQPRGSTWPSLCFLVIGAGDNIKATICRGIHKADSGWLAKTVLRTVTARTSACKTGTCVHRSNYSDLCDRSATRPSKQLHPTFAESEQSRFGTLIFLAQARASRDNAPSLKHLHLTSHSCNVCGWNQLALGESCCSVIRHCYNSFRQLVVERSAQASNMGKASTSASKRLHVFVSGSVQGVFFRAYTKNKALELGLTGWVRNRRDGRVEVTAEGYEEDLQELLRWLHTGSPLSDVSGIESSWSAATGEFQGFDKLWTE